MLGYLRDAEKSLEAIDADGWQHSGDVGRFEVLQDGAAPMLKITGRIKELLVTAGGENVAPAPIEDDLKRRLPGVSTAVVIGDRLKFLSVLFTLKQRPNEDTFDDVLVGAAAAVNPEVTTAVEAADDATWRRTLQAAIDDYNKEKATSSAQRVQKFAILPLVCLTASRITRRRRRRDSCPSHDAGGGFFSDFEPRRTARSPRRDLHGPRRWRRAHTPSTRLVKARDRRRRPEPRTARRTSGDRRAHADAQTQKGGSRRKVRGRAQAALRRRAKRCVVPLTRSPLYARPKRRLCN